MYLAIVAMLTLILLAWHFSIQAAAHDAAISQVRVWLKGMGATAGRVQFRLLRGALTIENINLNIWDAPLTIESLFIKGNPASITTSTPQLQYIRIQNMFYQAPAAQEKWQDISFQLPSTIQTIFRYAKDIDVFNSVFYDLAHYSTLSLEQLQVSGPTTLRKIDGHGTLQYHEEHGTWQTENYFPAKVSEQSGNFLAVSPNHQAELTWNGSWEKQNMQLAFNHQDTDTNASLGGKLTQYKNEWRGNIQTQAWPIHLPNMESLLSGQMSLSGQPNAWQLKSDKLEWEETLFVSEQSFIQSMTSYGVSMYSHENNIRIQRLDMFDTNIVVSTALPFLKSTWHLDIPSINLHELYTTFEHAENVTSLPPMSGVASIKHGQLTFDISEQEDESQFWRIHGQANKQVTLIANHIPLFHLRNLLPSPLLNQTSSIQGALNLTLQIEPDNHWQTSGAIAVSDLSLSFRNQIFSAGMFEMSILNADETGVHNSTISANNWSIQLPLTPKQAWAEHSHLDSWAQIPWGINHAELTDGKVLIGNIDHLWLTETDMVLNHWHTQATAELALRAKIGLAPFQSRMHFIKNENQFMQWQKLSIAFEGADMFFLEDWLQLSNLPLPSQGHFSLLLSATQNDAAITGDIDLQLQRIHLLDSGSKHLQQELNYPIEKSPMKFVRIHTPFAGEGDWSSLAGHALLASAKAGLDKQPQNKKADKMIQKRLGSLRIQQDIRLSLNERTRLRKLIQAFKNKKHFIIELTPDIGTSPLTPKLKKQVIQTQYAIQTFMQERGISRNHIFTILPQPKHHSNSDVGAVHINLVE